MAEIRIGTPIPCKRKGRPPAFDKKILCVAGQSDKYLHEPDRIKKDSIRRRARQLGFSVEVFADAGGGWDIKIN